MSWVDKLNEWALKRIRPAAIERVETDREGTTLIRADGSQFIRWSDVQEIAVLKQPLLAIGCFALAIRPVGSPLAIVDDTVAVMRSFAKKSRVSSKALFRTKNGPSS